MKFKIDENLIEKDSCNDSFQVLSNATSVVVNKIQDELIMESITGNKSEF